MSKRNFLTDKRIEWHINKIGGGIAEATCRAHFEALGYAVESFGIENIAPQYCSIKDGAFVRGQHGAHFKNTLQSMPDFLVSRRHPETASLTKLAAAGQLDAFLVDAKFRSSVVLDDFNKEIAATYEKILQRDIHFFIYLVAKESKTFAGSPQKLCRIGGEERKVYVHLGYFPGLQALDGQAKWWAVGETGLLDMPICHGMDEGDHFSSIYAEVVHPALAGFLG